MPTTLFLIPLFEILGLVGFISFSASLGSHEIRYLPLVLAAGIVVWLAAKSSRELTPRQILVASVVVSLIFVTCFQVLGFVFPGLAKDVEIISLGNLVRLGSISMIATVAHAGLFAAVRYLRR